MSLDNLNKLLEQNKQLQISLQQQQEINSQAISSFERISEENIELKDLLEKYVDFEIDFLLTDCEGYDFDINKKIIEIN